MLHAMSSDLSDLTGRLRASRIGVVLALLTIFSGFAMGGVMGAFEEELKSGLAARANAAASSVYGGDAALELFLERAHDAAHREAGKDREQRQHDADA